MDPQDAYLMGMLAMLEHVEGVAHDIGCLSTDAAQLLRLEASNLRQLYNQLALQREQDKERVLARMLFNQAARKDGLV